MKDKIFMSRVQKWLIVVAVWGLALGVLLSEVRKRYEIEPYSMTNTQGVVQTAGFTKKDTWTGRLFLKMTVPLTEDSCWVEVK